VPTEPAYRWNHPCPPTRSERGRSEVIDRPRPTRSWLQQVLALRIRKAPTTSSPT
jgi:hypothetical protein